MKGNIELLRIVCVVLSFHAQDTILKMGLCILFFTIYQNMAPLFYRLFLGICTIQFQEK